MRTRFFFTTLAVIGSLVGSPPASADGPYVVSARIKDIASLQAGRDNHSSVTASLSAFRARATACARLLSPTSP